MKSALAMALIAIFGVSQSAYAQESTRTLLKSNTTPTVIPVFNVHSGQIEALLVLDNEPLQQQRVWVRSAKTRLQSQAQIVPTGLRVEAGLTLFCAGQQNSFSQLSLLDSCQLGKKSNRYPAVNSPGLETKALLQRKGNAGGLGLLLPSNGQRPLIRTEFDSPSINDKPFNASPVQAQVGWVSINGNVSRARLIPASQFPGGIPTEWDDAALNLPERKRSISGEVVGNVVKIPGQEANLQSIGAGVSWNTPWRSKVSVGAESLLQQGRSSLGDNSTSAPIINQSIDGVRPYVRVEIDL